MQLGAISGHTSHTTMRLFTYYNEVVHSCTDSGHRLRDVWNDPTFLCLLMQDHKLRHLWEEEAPSDWNEVRWTQSLTPSTQAIFACCTKKQEVWYMYAIPIMWAWCNGKNGRHHFTYCSTDYTLNHWTYRTVAPSWLDKCPGTFTLWGVLSPSVPTHNQSLSTIHPFYPIIIRSCARLFPWIASSEELGGSLGSRSLNIQSQRSQQTQIHTYNEIERSVMPLPILDWIQSPAGQIGLLEQ